MLTDYKFAYYHVLCVFSSPNPFFPQLHTLQFHDLQDLFKI
jgi:hypothetical protein